MRTQGKKLVRVVGCLLIGCQLLSQRPTHDLAYPRANFTALVRSDNRVYLFGNAGPDLPLEIYQMDSASAFGATAASAPATVSADDRILACLYTCEIYTPQLGLWAPTAFPGLETQVVRLLDGRLLRAGGLTSPKSFTSVAFLVDSGLSTSVRTGDMTHARRSSQVVLRDGHVLAAGGSQSPLIGGLRDAEVYDPQAGQWTPIAGMQSLAGDVLLTALADGRALATGLAYSTAAPMAEVYDPVSNQWRLVPSLGAALSGDINLNPPGENLSSNFVPISAATTLLPNGKVLISGGRTDLIKPLDRTLLFDPTDAHRNHAPRVGSWREFTTAVFGEANAA